MVQVEVEVKLDLPERVELLGYECSGDGDGFEVKFLLPDFCRCEQCGQEEPATYYSVNAQLWGGVSGRSPYFPGFVEAQIRSFHVDKAVQ